MYTTVKCKFTINSKKKGWYWQSGPPIDGKHNQLETNYIGDTLTYIINIPHESDYWYVMPLAVFPNQAFGYGFVQYSNGHLRCKVQAIGSKGWSPKEGENSVEYGDLKLTARIID